MSGFSAEWLSLREPADARARAGRLLERLRSDRAQGADLSVIDLGCGTGANLRYLARRLGGRQRWLAVDDDDDLLLCLPNRLHAWATGEGLTCTGAGAALVIAGEAFHCTVETIRLDASSRLNDIDIGRRAIVTGSALLDLVSERWLDEIAERCGAASASMLFALSYDGRMNFDPADGFDERVRQCVNRHQLTDKGFGPALGPAAAATAARIFEKAGYRTEREPSDWLIGPGERELQQALLAGWHGAAIDVEPDARDSLAAWIERRIALVESGRSTIRVGHQDIVAVPRSLDFS